MPASPFRTRVNISARLICGSLCQRIVVIERSIGNSPGRYRAQFTSPGEGLSRPCSEHPEAAYSYLWAWPRSRLYEVRDLPIAEDVGEEKPGDARRSRQQDSKRTSRLLRGSHSRTQQFSHCLPAAAFGPVAKIIIARRPAWTAGVLQNHHLPDVDIDINASGRGDVDCSLNVSANLCGARAADILLAFPGCLGPLRRDETRQPSRTPPWRQCHCRTSTYQMRVVVSYSTVFLLPRTV